MSEQKRFGRRRRGMHFKPSNQGPKPTKQQERDAQQARAEVVNENVPITGERLFEPQRYAREIERSENVAAGLLGVAILLFAGFGAEVAGFKMHAAAAAAESFLFTHNSGPSMDVDILQYTRGDQRAEH